MTAQLRVRVWEGDEMVEEVLVDRDTAMAVAARHKNRYDALLADGRRCRVVVDDPDDPDGQPWMEAREDGVVLVYGRSISLDQP